MREPGVISTGMNGGIAAGHSINSDSALRLSAVWACVKLTAEAVGSMPLVMLKIEKDGSRTPVTDHPLINLINAGPNQWQTRNEFFETAVMSALLHGNSYNEILRDSKKRILTIKPLMPPQMVVNLNRSNGRKYDYTEGGVMRPLTQDQVWHIPLMPGNGVIGLSPIQYAARTMGIAMAAEDRVSTLAANGFKPTGVLMIDKVLKPEQREQIKKEFADLETGNGDPLKVLESSMTYQPLSISPKDAQLIETRGYQVEDICRFYGVPSVLVNDTSATTAWGSGIAQIKQGWYTLGLQPLLRKIAQSLWAWLLDPSERGQYEFRFDVDDFLRGSEADQITMFTGAITGKLLTIDEARDRYRGLRPLPNGVGSVMYDQSQMIPIGTTAPATGIVDRRRKANEGQNGPTG